MLVIIVHNFVFSSVILRFWKTTQERKSDDFITTLRLIRKIAFTFQNELIKLNESCYISSKKKKYKVMYLSLFSIFHNKCVFLGKNPQNSFWFNKTKVADGSTLDMLTVTFFLCRHCADNEDAMSLTYNATIVPVHWA